MWLEEEGGCKIRAVSFPSLNPYIHLFLPSLSPWCCPLWKLSDTGGEAGLEKKHLLIWLRNKQKKREENKGGKKSVCINRKRQTEAGLLVEEVDDRRADLNLCLWRRRLILVILNIIFVKSYCGCPLSLPSSSSPQPSATPASS